jgi:hypothetical protein
MARPSEIDWVAVKVAYVSGKESFRALAKRFELTESAVKRRMVAEGWYAERKKYQADLVKRQTRSIAKDETRKRERIFKVADKLLDIIEQGLADGSIPGQGRSYRDVTGALKDIKDIREIRDPLQEQEQIARIERLRAEAKRANEITGADIKITIAPELEEYTE